jgi:methylated-DNA-[protein]-cysteine S-methyltransferase
VTVIRTHAVVDGPLGPMTLVGQGGSLAGLYLDGQRHPPPADCFGDRDDRTLPDLQEQLRAYLAGELQAFDVDLAPVGTPFQTQVWAALRRVPYGSTTTYGALAADIGRPSAVRAVGAANGRNPYCLIVPCHRVVGADGSLTGYAGGLERKRFLLDLERAGAPDADAAPGQLSLTC